MPAGSCWNFVAQLAVASREFQEEAVGAACMVRSLSQVSRAGREGKARGCPWWNGGLCYLSLGMLVKVEA